MKNKIHTVDISESLHFMEVSSRYLCIVTQDWRVKINDQEYIIPKGFTSDGATIPKWLLSTKLISKGPYIKPAVLHDWLINVSQEYGLHHNFVHKVFQVALQSLQIRSTRLFFVGWAVRLFGPKWTLKNNN